MVLNPNKVLNNKNLHRETKFKNSFRSLIKINFSLTSVIYIERPNYKFYSGLKSKKGPKQLKFTQRPNLLYIYLIYPFTCESFIKTIYLTSSSFLSLFGQMMLSVVDCRMMYQKAFSPSTLAPCKKKYNIFIKDF